ncbi:Rne/Rng family ribonuclease [Psychrobacter sp. 1Y11]|uniref:Rne/Rng family ribonuclease n=1 Tax=Psychrobacter sp. 1Y11 TaxID=3457446 RepID=UPI003FD4ACE4
MKRILINATQNEEIRVALCKGNHLYDFDLENRTREQKKSNIYKGHVTRVEPSLEAVFVEYGSQRQGFLPIREISTEYLSGNPRDENIKKLIKEGDELIVQVEKEERGNKGAALSTYVSLAGRYLVLMPNNPRGGGISRQISGKLREDMKRMLGNLDLPKGMSVIIRTAGIGKTQEDLQHDLNHLLNIWQAIQEQNKKYPSPRLVHQEAGVVTRAVRDYLRDDISEIWIDNENAYVEAAGFIDAVMPKQAEKLRKYTDYEPMFSRFNIEKQIETAYQREVRLPSGGSIVIDQTEALVSIDINSAKSTKGSDVAETAYHTNLEAADEIARQLRLRDMGGLIVIDFIDMNDNKHQKEVEKRLVDATKYDRARVQFGDISKFGLMEMSRQRLRPSLEESTGYICPRCHGNGMIRDLRSLSLSIMRQIEQIALKERQGEVQAEVPTDIAAFLLNEKRDSLVYLEQDSGTRITILPHAHLESPNFKLHFNRDGFAPSSYERITDTQQQEHNDLGYDVDWQTAENERPEQQPTRQPRQNSKPNNPNQSSQNKAENDSTNSRQANGSQSSARNNSESRTQSQQHTADRTVTHSDHSNEHRNQTNRNASSNASQTATTSSTAQPQAVAWLSNLFAKAPQAKVANVSSRDAAEAIEALVNTGAQSLGSLGQTDSSALSQSAAASPQDQDQSADDTGSERQHKNDDKERKGDDRRRRKTRKPKSSQSSKSQQRKEQRDGSSSNHSQGDNDSATNNAANGSRQDSRTDNKNSSDKRHSDRNTDNDRNGSNERQSNQRNTDSNEQTLAKRKPHSKRSSRGSLERGETLDATAQSSSDDQVKSEDVKQNNGKQNSQPRRNNDTQAATHARRNQDPNEVTLQVNEAPVQLKTPEVVHLSLDDSKAPASRPSKTDKQASDKKTDAQKASQTTAKESANNSEKSASLEANKDAASVKAENAKPADSTQNADKTVTGEHKEATAAADVASDKQTAEPSRAFVLDHDSLFAARYVTANKFGQASNDPRVVRSQQLANAQPQADNSAAAVVSPTPSIRGSVGAFIRATLASAEKRLADEGVIHCFIAAIAEHSQQKAGAEDSTAKQNTSSATVDISTFSFSNYGYDSLSAEYLQRFSAMTTATSQVAIEQGKTAVAPRPIAQRASNDPRGQHPDYKGTTQQATLTVPEVAGDTSEVDADDVEATALSREAQAESIAAESEQLLQEDQALASQENLETSVANEPATADSEAAATDSAGAEKSKTTIASYKNMIENVAEQLLPQTGMFNLTTPKVPKARTRKPKTEHKKPTQAEKAEAENVDKEADS